MPEFLVVRALNRARFLLRSGCPFANLAGSQDRDPLRVAVARRTQLSFVAPRHHEVLRLMFDHRDVRTVTCDIEAGLKHLLLLQKQLTNRADEVSQRNEVTIEERSIIQANIFFTLTITFPYS